MKLRHQLAAVILALLPLTLYAQKVGQLPVASALTGAESIPAVQVGSCAATGGTCQTTPAQIATYVQSKLPVFVPTALTAAGIQSAMAAAGTAGGGVVSLPPGTISLSATLIPVQGVYLVGVAPQVNTTSGIPDNPNATFTAGTVLTCTGSFPAISFNTTALGTPASSGAFTANGIYNVGFKNFGVQGCTYGIQAGATNAASFWYGEFENLYFSGQTVWGMWVTNYQHCNFRRIYSFGAANGQFHGADVPGNILNPGNSTYYDLYNVIPSGSTTNWASRGIVFNTANTVAGENDNQFEMDRIQSNRFGATSVTQAATMAAAIATTITNTSASIAATNTFAAGDPVTFSATVGTAGGQVLINTTYFVSATGLSGSAFQVSATVGGAVITFNAGGTPNVQACYFTVVDGTKFLVDLPVAFSAAVDGFATTTIYFVTSISTNKIAVSKTQGGSFWIGTTGATAVNITHNGFPAFEFVGRPGSTITNGAIRNLDVEGGGTCAALFQNATGNDVTVSQLPQAGQSTVSICGRGVSGTVFRSGNSYNTDFDTGFSNVQSYGVKNYTSVGTPGAGIAYDTVSGNTSLSLGAQGDTPASGALTYVPTGSGLVQGNNIAEKGRTNANAAPADSILGGQISYTAANTVITLPAVTATTVGMATTYVNQTATTQTINTSSSQLFNGKAGLTSLTLGINASVRIKAAIFSAGVFGYTIEGYGGTYSAGVITGL